MSEDAAIRAWTAMRSLVLELHDRRFSVAEATGMSYLRVKALQYLLDGPLPMRELGSSLLTDPPYITVMVDDLEKRGYVRREANPADRRSKLVRITTEGRAVAKKAAVIQSTPPEQMTSLSQEELTRLEATLLRLVEESQG